MSELDRMHLLTLATADRLVSRRQGGPRGRGAITELNDSDRIQELCLKPQIDPVGLSIVWSCVPGLYRTELDRDTAQESAGTVGTGPGC